MITVSPPAFLNLLATIASRIPHLELPQLNLSSHHRVVSFLPLASALLHLAVPPSLPVTGLTASPLPHRFGLAVNSAVSTRSLEDFKAFIEQQEQIIRRCYQSKFPHIGSEQFVRIILLDSVFNMELFLREAKRWKHKDDCVLTQRCLSKSIQRDLLLLQNQLPNQVLEKLYETCVPSNLKEHSRFVRLAHEYFASCYPYQKSSERKFEPKKWEKSLHFTDLFQR
ncbi:uncharacterized protein DS421_12g364020 [Arachis hypogaea]|nr:uncharacterized protein DS421_12g364020 [Arachis hypogaea]